ncbi:MAG: DsbC family protein [Desulfuromonadales bacterium]
MQTLLILIAVLFATNNALAMSSDGCGAGSCTACHSLTKAEAEQLLGNMVDKVNSVEFSEVPGMWVAEVEKGQKKLPVYIDFSKQYLVSGNVIRLNDKENLTSERSARMNKVDVSRISVADALLLGKPSAKTKVIVFTDPECPYCKKLHVELKDVVRRDPNIAFLIKLFPLKMHPNAYEVSKSIVCSNSMELLELSFAGKPVPPASCATTAVDQTLALVGELGISSTPTLVLPDGLIVPGYKTADALMTLIRENVARVVVQ